MAIINIGTSGYIEYSILNNSCYNTSQGSISIDTIVFDDLFSLFNSYTINWTANSGTINSNQIRDNGRSLVELVADTYNFTIESLSTSSSLGPYSVSVTSPNQFAIIDIESSVYSCTDNGTIKVVVSGGSPPYNFNIGNTTIEHSGNELLATGLLPDIYTIDVNDSNGCVANVLVDSNQITLKSAGFSVEDTDILPPETIDGYGQLDFAISGYGPFNFSFIKNDETNYNFDSLDTTYLKSYNPYNSTYYYSFKNLLTPGNYTVNITNNFDCFDIQPVTIPNISPMVASINIIPNIIASSPLPSQIFAIFDTIFIPFKHIKNNTSLWQLVLKFIHDNKIDIKINNQVVSYQIIKTFLYPYCIDNNNIEIVRLDNNEHNWFFVFHIAPGINLADNLSLIGSEFFLLDKDSNEEHKCLFGLDDNSNISYEYASLLMGSLTIFGASNQYIKDTDIYVRITEIPPQDLSDYDFIIKEIVPTTYFNIRAGQYTTSIYFLDNFNTLIQNINLNQTACEITSSDYQYILNIKQLLLEINNFNNYQNLYIANKTSISNVGSVTTFITGNDAVVQNGELIPNIYNVNYFTFDKNSKQLLSFYKNNQIVQNTFLLNNIPDGYVIMRISDLNNNNVSFINVNNTIINYDNHFSNAKNFLNNYNIYIKDKFEYGDILMYVPNNLGGGGSSNLIPTTPVTPPVTPTPLPTGLNYNTIYQSKDEADTASLIIETLPSNSICYLLGPKNYRQKFIGSTKFENLIPGVYNIVGDDSYLSDNKLFNSTVRLVALKNQEYSLTINFNSYLDKVFIKE